MSTLCSRCERLFEAAEEAFANSNALERLKGSFGPYLAWKNSAKISGCHLCSILFSLRREDAIAELKSHGCEDGILFYFNDSFLEESGCFILDLYHPTYHNTRILRSGVRFAKSSGSENLTSQSTSRLRALTTWSEDSPALVRSWLSECSDSSSHEQCRPRRQRQRLPLRLLDVSLAESSKKKEQKSEDAESLPQSGIIGVRISSSSHLPLDTPYLTLSHCWGKHLKMKLSHSNMAEYTSPEGIPPHVFADPSAATFRDAILVTRSLGFHYLWIDSLCINQEDNIEKGDEIMFMHEIYRHADLNMSATAAIDGFGGLFQKRNPLILYPCISRRRVDLVAFTSPLIHFTSEVLQGPVNQRSWVLQERLLARRVLHFCSAQIFWECFTHQGSESISHWPSGSRLSQVTKTKGELSPNNDQESLSIENAKLSWENIIELYSRTAISYPQDRLPALSALARVMWERRHQDMREYAAGMWTADLPLALLWRVSSSARITLTTYLAPTWSWISVLRDVDVRDQDSPVKTCFASVVDISTTTGGPVDDPFGQVEAGYLELRCPLGSLDYNDHLRAFTVGRVAPAIITVIASTFPGSVRDNLPDKKYVMIDEYIPPTPLLTSQSHSPPFEYPNTLILEWDHGIPGIGETYHIPSIPLPGGRKVFLRDEHRFFLAPICEVDDDPEISPSGHVEGIILQSSQADNEYVRVGLFYYTGPRDKDEIRRDFIFGKDQDLGEVSFQTKHDDGTFTIRII